MVSEGEREVQKMLNKLKQKRKELGYTINDMTRVIDKSAPNYSMKENGKVKCMVVKKK